MWLSHRLTAQTFLLIHCCLGASLLGVHYREAQSQAGSASSGAKAPISQNNYSQDAIGAISFGYCSSLACAFIGLILVCIPRWDNHVWMIFIRTVCIVAALVYALMSLCLRLAYSAYLYPATASLIVLTTIQLAAASGLVGNYIASIFCASKCSFGPPADWDDGRDHSIERGDATAPHVPSAPDL